jgi:hypothetical protein
MIDVKNVRVTVVSREGESDWAGTGRYLSIRAYRDSGQLMMGPDIPINSEITDAEIERMTKLFIEMVCGPDRKPMTDGGATCLQE